MGFMERFLYFMMGLRRIFLYISNKFFLDVDMETWFLGIWHFVEMWIFFYLYVIYPAIELSSLCLFFLDIKGEIVALCLFLGQKVEETL